MNEPSEFEPLKYFVVFVVYPFLLSFRLCVCVFFFCLRRSLCKHLIWNSDTVKVVVYIYKKLTYFKDLREGVVNGTTIPIVITKNNVSITVMCRVTLKCVKDPFKRKGSILI